MPSSKTNSYLAEKPSLSHLLSTVELVLEHSSDLIKSLAVRSSFNARNVLGRVVCRVAPRPGINQSHSPVVIKVF